MVTGSFITTTHPLMHHDLCSVFWQNVKSPRWLSPATAQIWCSETSGFSQNQNHFWKGGDFRSSTRFRKIRWGNWWLLEELCESEGAYFEGDWGIIVLCTMFLVYCIFFNKCLCFSYYIADTLYLVTMTTWMENITLLILQIVYIGSQAWFQNS